MKIRVVTLCSGYDSQCLALERLKENFPNFDYELVAWAEIDKYAIQAHNALFPQWADRNVGDITTCDWSGIKDIDLLCYSTPCTSISNAGLQQGFKEGTGTASSIIWSVRNAIKELKPKYLLMENVAAMVQKKFINDFHDWQKAVEDFGYDNYTQVLNAKDYGVPQNRERVFMVSIRNDIGQQYHFPKPFKLEKRLKDVLETNVEEKYYLSQNTIESFKKHCERKQKEGCGFKFEPTNIDGYAKCLNTLSGNRQTDNFIKETLNEQEIAKDD
jgi:DNA (cytosine-5)-methyltransferase 1